MRRGTGAVRLTVQALQLTLLLGSLGSLLLLSSLSSLLLLGSLRCLLLLGPLRCLLLSSLSSLLLLGSLRCLLLSSLSSLLLLGSLRCLLLSSLSCLLLLSSLGSLLLLGSLSLLLSGLLLRRKPLLRSAQPLIGARLRGRSPGRLIRLSPRRCLSVRPLLLHIKVGARTRALRKTRRLLAEPATLIFSQRDWLRYLRRRPDLILRHADALSLQLPRLSELLRSCLDSIRNRCRSREHHRSYLIGLDRVPGRRGDNSRLNAGIDREPAIHHQ
jgi:hypothetical protein